MLTYSEAKKAMDQLIVENGINFVYNPAGAYSCFYAPIPEVLKLIEENPKKSTIQCFIDWNDSGGFSAVSYEIGCAVGSILERTGYLTDDIRLSQKDIGEIVELDMLEVDEYAAVYLSSLQSSQDAGISWGKAHEVAQDAVAVEVLRKLKEEQ